MTKKADRGAPVDITTQPSFGPRLCFSRIWRPSGASTRPENRARRSRSATTIPTWSNILPFRCRELRLLVRKLFENSGNIMTASGQEHDKQERTAMPLRDRIEPDSVQCNASWVGICRIDGHRRTDDADRGRGNGC